MEVSDGTIAASGNANGVPARLSHNPFSPIFYAGPCPLAISPAHAPSTRRPHNEDRVDYAP